jgi:SRSO17 transposase
VLIGDDTGFEKGGSCSAGVQRQYTGTAGKITNCQIGVFLAYASAKGWALIERAVIAGIPFGWVTADEAYGDNGPLRAFLEQQQISYVLAVSRDHVITTAAGRRCADILARRLLGRAWQRLSCGDGAPPQPATRAPLPLPATTPRRSLGKAPSGGLNE